MRFNKLKPQYRRYLISSSFIMAFLFALLLGISLTLWGYILVHFWEVFDKNIILKVSIFVSMICTIIVIGVSFFISIYVVRRINHISNTAVSMMQTNDLSQRIHIVTRWDDLSNLAHVLNQLLDKIEKLMYDLKVVSDNIAHDLRTPLTRMRNELSVLKSQHNNFMVDKALTECENLLNTFNTILRISYLEHGKQILFKKNYAIDQILHDAILYYMPAFEGKNITMHLMIAEKTLSLDRDLCFQAIINILDNTSYYAPEDSDVKIVGEISEYYYVIKFIDQGVGIKMENINKIFNRFFREDKSRSNQGSGLGLSMAKVVIQKHMGKISANNNLEQGLTVTVKLPLL
ncbi:HAMP domain-containing histidine kinase [Thiotrichales bacterium 19S3-7]|nr:HAMP domain-containing histidine kinase [Thiotrichales bacterium 19S3-7]MCF6800643.1 HAMP domain-containing histidine kinase [Thiotrichales bacterium 19S3-11]